MTPSFKLNHPQDKVNLNDRNLNVTFYSCQTLSSTAPERSISNYAFMAQIIPSVDYASNTSEIGLLFPYSIFFGPTILGARY